MTDASTYCYSYLDTDCYCYSHTYTNCDTYRHTVPLRQRFNLAISWDRLELHLVLSRKATT